jgi:CubicO group peptidase (beta-lactamase class C family)
MMREKRAFATFVAIIFFSFVTLAHADKIDDFIVKEMAQQRIPGLSLAIVKNGKIVKTRGYGMANLELRVKATPKTVYQLGSVSKQFTATLAMKLAEDGKINLDDPLRKYWTDLPASWQEITIRQLMAHTSGLAEYASTSVGGPSTLNERLDYTDEALLEMFKKQPLDFAPGSKWDYSDTGYVVLGMLIKKATGQFYGDLLQSNFLKPLSMNATRIISEADIIPNRAAGYWLDNGVLKNQPYVSPSLNTVADGGLYSTVLDMAKWDKALYGDSILKQSALVQLWTPITLSNGVIATNDFRGMHYECGLGWFMAKINGHRVVEHSGWWQGFTSFFARYIDDKVSVIVLTNLAAAKTGDIAHQVAGLYDAALAPSPQVR